MPPSRGGCTLQKPLKRGFGFVSICGCETSSMATFQIRLRRATSSLLRILQRPLSAHVLEPFSKLLLELSAWNGSSSARSVCLDIAPERPEIRQSLRQLCDQNWTFSISLDLEVSEDQDQFALFVRGGGFTLIF